MSHDDKIKKCKSKNNLEINEKDEGIFQSFYDQSDQLLKAYLRKQITLMQFQSAMKILLKELEEEKDINNSVDI